MSNFAKVQAEVSQQFAETAANRREGNWLPEPPFKGAVELKETSEQDGKMKDGTAFWSLKAKLVILDGEHTGKTIMQDFFFPATKSDKPTKGMIGLCDLASCLAGKTIKDFAEAVAIVKGSKGAVLNVNTFKTKAKKDGKEYTNLGYNKRVDRKS